jgi:DNA-3-methyladenine glycosylase
MLENQHSNYLDRSFFDRPATQVAPDLLGHLLVRETPEGVMSGIVVETEAYMHDDPAFHAWGVVDPPTGLVKPVGRAYDLFGPPGRAYVYLCYGMYWLLNVVTEREGQAGCVLIRAMEPVSGLNQMWSNRPNVTNEVNLANGPGKLTIALGIGKEFHGLDLISSPLYFSEQKVERKLEITSSSRIGITRATDRPWRYFLTNNRFVSPGVPSDIASTRRQKPTRHSQ